MSIWKIINKVFIGIVVVFALFIGLFIFPYFANIVMPWERANAIETALGWGGLSELPPEAEDISVGTGGNMFTRSFTIEFVSESKDIDVWITKSKGLNGLIPKVNNLGILVYDVPGQKGSIGGKVFIDRKEGKIKINMSWS